MQTPQTDTSLKHKARKEKREHNQTSKIMLSQSLQIKVVFSLPAVISWSNLPHETDITSLTKFQIVRYRNPMDTNALKFCFRLQTHMHKHSCYGVKQITVDKNINQGLCKEALPE